MPDGDGPDEAAVTRDMLGLLVTLPKASRRRVVDTLARACGDVARRKNHSEDTALLPLPELRPIPELEKDITVYGGVGGVVGGKGVRRRNGHAPDDELPEASPILKALSRCARLGAVPKLRTAAFWMAEKNANPDVSAVTELAKAEAWLVAHPRRHKTDLVKFVHNWLSNAQADEAASG